MPECPSDAELTGFLNESLPPERVSRLSIHVDGCQECQTRLDKLTHDVDGAVARYKELSSVRGLVSPDAGTLIVGVDPLPSARLLGLPSVPGFDVIEEIGRGGMGVVYKARHRRLNRLVALKMILAGGAADARVVQRFLFEAEILARIQHPQVVQVYEVDTYQGPSGVPIPYLAMELLEGGSLSRRLRERSAGNSDATSDQGRAPFDPRTAAELLEGIARAVHAVHQQGVIHRDLKPGNILFGNDEGRRMQDEKKTGTRSVSDSTFILHPSSLPKVTDFGLAKFTEAGLDLTGSGQVVGTPHYVSPEQAAGSRDIGPGTDVHALGAILFECLTGRPPFPGGEPMSVLLKVVNETPPDVRTLRPDLPRDLAAVVMRCLEKDLRRRYASAADLADDLQRFLENRPTLARPVTSRERAWLWAKRNPAVAGLMVALSTVLLVAFVAITSLWMRAERTTGDERAATERATRAHGEAAASLADARQQKENADKALAEATRQKENADLQQAHLEFARAVHWCDEGRVAEGLDAFVRVVELAGQTRATNLAHVARVNLAIWPRELPTARRVLTYHNQPRAIAFFPDGRRAVVATRGGSLFLWDTTTDQKGLVYRQNFQYARSDLGLTLFFTYWTAAISPDGKTVVAGGTDGQVWVWDVDSPDPRTTIALASADEDVWAVAFAPDGTLWATDGRTGIRRLDLRTRKTVAQGIGSPEPAAIIQSMIVSSDGKRLFTGDRNGTIREWDAAKAIPTRWWPTQGWVSDLALSPDEHFLAATGTDGFVRVIDLIADKQIHQIDLSGAYGNGVAFAPNQPLLIATDGDGNVRTWHRTTGVPVGIPIRLSGEVLRPRFPPKGNEFAVAAGNAIYRCQSAGLPGQLLLPAKGDRVRGLDFSPTGDRLAIAIERQLNVFDPRKGERIGSYQTPKSALSIRHDPDPTRHRVIRGTRDGYDAIDLATGNREILNANRDWVVRLGFAPGDGALLTLDKNALSRWKPLAFNRASAKFRDPDMPSGVEMTGLEVRQDGRELMVTYANKLVFLDPDTLEKSRPGYSVADEILDAKYLPGGTRILVGRRDSVAQILDAATGTAIGPPMTHARAVTAVAISPDGQVLLTGSRDGTARFWDAATGLPLGPPLHHGGPVTHVGYGPRGDHVATGTGTGDVLLWNPPSPPLAGSLDELRAAVKKTRE